MNAWGPDSLTSSNGIYNPLPDSTTNPNLIDPSMFPANSIDLAQLQNSQLQQRLHNGAVRNQSPAFNNPAYQVNQVIPSKRPRPTESTSGSPRQTPMTMPGAASAPGSINLSRSQTPQQVSYPGYQGNQHGGPPLQAPMPYQHLQQAGSSNATPSPTLPNQPFRPPAPQRMNTVSPSPYPQPQQSMGMSPPADQASRVSTPQNPNMAQMGAGMGSMAGMNYMPGATVPQGYGQNFGATPGMPSGVLQGGLPVQPVTLPPNLQAQQSEAQRMYQMRLQQQRQIAASNLASQRQASAMNAMLGSTGQQPGLPSNVAMQPNQAAMAMLGNRTNEEQFIKRLTAFMQPKGLPFNPTPVVAMRPISLFLLWSHVMKRRGSKRVTASREWPVIAQLMGFPQDQAQIAAELQFVYEKSLWPFEQAWWQSQHQQMAAMSTGQQMSPTKAAPPMAANLQAQQQRYIQQLQQKAQATPPPQADQATPVQNNAVLTPNGWATPQNNQARLQNAFNQHRKSASRQLEATPPQVQQPTFPSASPGAGEKGTEAQASQDPSKAQVQAANGAVQTYKYGPQESTNYKPKVHAKDSFGGIYVDGAEHIGADIAALKPNVPKFDEMGLIDIHALGMSLQSGIHAEVRYALDILVKLSQETRISLELERCDDLVDTLMECAEAQVDVLAEDTTEVADCIDLASYEDVLRHAKTEQMHSLQDIAEVGTLAYDLERAADRLIAITIILRNLSFFESNHKALSNPTVVKWLSNTIRLLGTRHLLLRTYLNTIDFMKDMITFLSNISDKIELPSGEEAFNILAFLLAFAPSPAPSQPVRFTPYNPKLHKYLPPAVDAFAKLLARDDPNRAFYRHLFAAESTSNPPYDLLTRAFALAISVVPERTRALAGSIEMRIAEVRKPYLSQGMLVADILANLCPGPETGIARSWLDAEDGWAPSLLRLCVFLFSSDPRGQSQPHGPGGRPMPPRMETDSQGFGLITHRALAMLKRLGEKSGSGEDARNRVGGDGNAETNGVKDGEVKNGKVTLKVDVLPKKEMLLGALCTQNIDNVALRQLVEFANLDF